MTETVLAGTKVLDLSIWLPGPYCTMILGDLGAEVLKVERRLMGDPSRLAYPFANHQSCHFLTLNRNKKSIALNLRRDQGRQIFLELAAEADVIVESLKPGHVDQLGIGYEDVYELNPRIVYCSLSGYGQDGPYAERAGHDITYAALAGFFDLMPPNGEPVLPGSQLADLSGALFATIGILSALVQRDRTDTGTHIDVGMLDTMLSLLSPSAAALLCGQPARETYIYLAGQLPSYNLYRTSDGRYMALGAIEPAFWTDFCNAIGREDLLDKQFPPEDEREAVIGELQEIFSAQTRDEWIDFFADKNVCCEPVNSLEEALCHPQVQQRGMVSYVEHPVAGRIRQLRQPISFREARSPDLRGQDSVAAPLLGQHTVEILRGLGYGDEEIGRLRQQKVVAAPDDTPPPSTYSRRTPTG